MHQRLTGKVAAVVGFASTRSIAWGVAQALNSDGASLTFLIQSDRFRPALELATSQWPRPPSIVCCDVTDDEQINTAFNSVLQLHGRLDHLCHCVAHASAAALRAPLLECPRADFLAAHDVSAYSLVALCRAAAPLFNATRSAASEPSGSIGGSVVALSYLGAQRVVPGYRVMGPAKASLEAVARQLAVELVRHPKVVASWTTRTRALRSPRCRDLRVSASTSCLQGP